MIKNILTIAGSDPSGGAGIQADLKAISALGCYGMSVVTALTAQNTCGVRSVNSVPANVVEDQLRAVFSDIRVDAVKIGMLGSIDVMRVVAGVLREYKPEIVVLDPVMVATSGDSLMDENALDVLCDEILPLVCVMTPNKHEAEMIMGEEYVQHFHDNYESRSDPDLDVLDHMRYYASSLAEMEIDVLVTGGHFPLYGGQVIDVLSYKGETFMFDVEPVDIGKTHGTGCTLSSALACYMGQGQALDDAVVLAQRYVNATLRGAQDLDVGKGGKSLKHFDVLPPEEPNEWVSDLPLISNNDNRAGEFDLIAKYFAPLSMDGLKNDGAVLDVPDGMELVVTTDTLNEGVHFMTGIPSGLSYEAAWKSLRVSLSDLASMGAEPYAYQLSLSMPKDRYDDGWFEAFSDALRDDQKEFSIQLSGGDMTSNLDDKLSVSVTAFGFVPKGKVIKRDGAQDGDLLVVSGFIGDAALGLDIMLKKELDGASDQDIDYLTRRYTRPEPRLFLGKSLQKYAHAMVDVSDGLIADIEHIAQASGVRAVVNLNDVPLSDAAYNAGLDPCRGIVSGDDYELAFAMSPQDWEKVSEISKFCDVPVTVIGRFEKGVGIQVLDSDHQEIALDQKGWSHF